MSDSIYQFAPKFQAKGTDVKANLVRTGATPGNYVPVLMPVISKKLQKKFKRQIMRFQTQGTNTHETDGGVNAIGNIYIHIQFYNNPYANRVNFGQTDVVNGELDLRDSVQLGIDMTDVAGTVADVPGPPVIYGTQRQQLCRVNIMTCVYFRES